VPTAVAPEDPRSYYNVSDRLVREIDGAWKPDQYSNPNNPRSHYETTGPELWAQTDGRITHFVTGVGTGGTITGTGRYLKEVSDGKVMVVGADPEGLGLQRRLRPAVPRRRGRRGLLAVGVRHLGDRRDHRGVRTATASR
jgi:cysteine synthase